MVMSGNSRVVTPQSKRPLRRSSRINSRWGSSFERGGFAGMSEMRI
jgi:hypothetical protein